jgi:hypothetical protein
MGDDGKAATGSRTSLYLSVVAVAFALTALGVALRPR